MPSRGTTAARARAVGVSVGVALLLTACTSGGSSGPTPPTGIGTVTPRATPTTSPTEAPAPETAPPERPADLDAPSMEGATALVHYVLALYPYASTTNDLDEWQRLSHPDCTFCNSVKERVEEQIANDHHRRGGEITVSALTADQVDETYVAFSGSLHQEASEVIDTDGSVVSRSPEDALDVSMAAEYLDGKWLFVGLEVLDEGPEA